MDPSDAADCASLRVAGKTWSVTYAIHSHTFSTCTLHVQEGYWTGRKPWNREAAEVYLRTRFALPPMRAALSHKTFILHPIGDIKRRALAGGRMDGASDFDPSGVGRTRRGAAENQM